MTAKKLMSIIVLVAMITALVPTDSFARRPGSPYDRIHFCEAFGRSVAYATYQSCMNPSVGPAPDDFDQSVCESDSQMDGDRARVSCLVGFYAHILGVDPNRLSNTVVVGDGSLDLSKLQSITFKVNNDQQATRSVSLVVVNGILDNNKTASRHSDGGAVFVNGTTIAIDAGQDVVMQTISLKPGENTLTITGLGKGLLGAFVLDELIE